ncbi:hypothetical protein BCR35DRAFT_307767 [Leucosporidium creatinivorum]|uniref:Uncharacterized protein n=1 Tax=Leucosporidium creatinivorum TaxID=106004 RepID=A0A1Y2ELN6_9BASI|nr:hypothetical protein BCR35DRAFT_307767 [Leucosporidium creatinivorum]
MVDLLRVVLVLMFGAGARSGGHLRSNELGALPQSAPPLLLQIDDPTPLTGPLPTSPPHNVPHIPHIPLPPKRDLNLLDLPPIVRSPDLQTSLGFLILEHPGIEKTVMQCSDPVCVRFVGGGDG